MKILIKGAGDLATGIAHRLWKAGHDVVMTEIAVPTTVRRTVAFSRAVYEGSAVVEGVMAVHARNLEEIEDALDDHIIPVIVDEDAEIAKELCPEVVVDAILAKKNLGTTINDAGFVIGVGPGFTAGYDCHAVVETKRGHYLGKVIYEGSAIPNTGVPGEVGGHTIDRLITASSSGEFKPIVEIGDFVEKDQLLAYCNGVPTYAKMSGLVRGMLQSGVIVREGMKVGDIDSRADGDYIQTISDKARAIGGGVLEAVSGCEMRLGAVIRTDNDDGVVERSSRQYTEIVPWDDDLDDTRLAGIVLLAAGNSERYGSNKLLEDYEGEKLYMRALKLVEASRCDVRIVVTKYDEIIEAALDRGIVPVRNYETSRGVSQSIKCGIAKALELQPDIEGIVFCVCDQPGLKVKTLLEIMANFYMDDIGIVCASFNGRTGNPVLFARKYFGELLQLTGDVGGKAVMKRHMRDVRYIEADSEEELEDMDVRVE